MNFKKAKMLKKNIIDEYYIIEHLANCKLILYYLEGKRVEQDCFKAIEYYNKSASRT